MNNSNSVKLQDFRKKATKQAYIIEVLDCCHDVVIEFSNELQIPLIDLDNIQQVSDFMLTNVFNPEYNYLNNRKLIPNHHQRVTQWVIQRMTFGCYVYDSCKWLVDNNLVSSDFIPKNQDMTESMQLADQRHYQYIAKTIMNNASREVLNIVYYGTDR